MKYVHNSQGQLNMELPLEYQRALHGAAAQIVALLYTWSNIMDRILQQKRGKMWEGTRPLQGGANGMKLTM